MDAVPRQTQSLRGGAINTTESPENFSAPSTENMTSGDSVLVSGFPCRGRRQCAAEAASCCNRLQCIRHGFLDWKCEPKCVNVGHACGGPGQRTLSCCGGARCVRNPYNGNMRCEARVR